MVVVVHSTSQNKDSQRQVLTILYPEWNSTSKFNFYKKILLCITTIYTQIYITSDVASFIGPKRRMRLAFSTVACKLIYTK